ncbi:ataxin-7-like protein 2b isoform X2 [Genypterus blacodes]|uniref:ataxin-7-like protein 2b isoform X2 n=1 Tax=Genypterus blacodes TaxID=154954 RepID=UPI003F75ACBE
MAAVDRRNPNLDDFVGLNWSCWADGVNISPSDAGSNVEDNSKYGKSWSETMTLRREDMPIFGHCPSHDDFFLVVCGHCGQVVKPQAFEKHCERRHSPLTKMCSQSPTLATQQRPRPGRPPSNLPSSSSRVRQRDGRCQEAAAPSAALPVHQKRSAKAQKEAVSIPPVEKFSQENPPPLHSTSSPRPRVPLWHSGPLPPSVSSSSSFPTDKTQQCDESQTPPRGTRTFSRVNKNIDKKECDLDKQCGGLDPERKKQCTQQTDSIDQPQRALGWSKTSDDVKEQRSGSVGSAGSAGSAGRDVTSKDFQPHLEVLEEKPATQGSKLSFGSNCHILRSTEPSESSPEKEGDGTVKVEAQPPYPFNQSLLSSEESESEGQEEATDLPALPWHPKPLGLCTFGCRTLGCSIFTFDRRLHRLRFALSAMVEHHISKHLWKKMPQVSSGLRSCAIMPSAESPARKGARPSAAMSSRLKSTSSGQLETKSSQHNLQGTASASLGSPSPRNPVGRPSRTRARLPRDANTAQTSAKLSHSSQEQSSKHIRDPLLPEKGQPHSVNRVYSSPSSQDPVNGSLSQGKKPCPPLQPAQRRSPSPSTLVKKAPFPHNSTHPSPRGRGRPPAIQRKVLGCDNRGLAQKRKDSGEPLNASLTRTPKFRCLSSPSHSSLLSWKGESVGGALSLGREKRADS